MLAGGARAAYQTVLVNSPPEGVRAEMEELLMEIDALEVAGCDVGLRAADDGWAEAGNDLAKNPSPGVHVPAAAEM